MVSRNVGIRIWLMAALWSLAITAHARFLLPSDGPLPFRRDRIALDTAAIATMATELETLASSLPDNTPEERWLLAKTLALAIALSESNPTANATIQLDALLKGAPRQKPPEPKLSQSKQSLWLRQRWLETPEAGSDSQVLATLVADILYSADPKHPQAKNPSQPGQSASWEPWIPPLSAYQPPPVANPQKQSPAPRVEQIPAQPTIRLTQASIETISWRRTVVDGKFSWSLEPITLQMTAQTQPQTAKQDEEFLVSIGDSDEYGQATQPLRDSLKTLLKSHHDSLPNGARLRIRAQEIDQAIKAGHPISISAPSAVLASAAISGVKPQALVMGQLDADGVYRIPPAFWEMLLSASTSKPRRIILPESSLTYLNALLALEKPEFFMTHEVLVAKNLRELLRLSAAELDEPAAAAATKFAEIRERMGSRSLRDYIGNPFIRQRLADVLQTAPWHASAKMLLIQASGQRLTMLPTSVLAAEIRRAIEPSAWMAQQSGDFIAPSVASAIGPSYQECDRKLDALERYCERADRPLFERAREVMAAFRAIDRAVKSRGENSIIMEKIREAKKSWWITFQLFQRQLNQTIGESSANGTQPLIN